MTKLEKLIQEFCPDGVEFRPLEQCCNILDRKRKPVTKSSREAGKYPYYGANGIQDYVSDYIFDGTFILVGEDGSVITDRGTPVVTWASGKIWVNNHAHIIEGNGTVLLRFLYHYIQTIDVSPLIHGNIPKLTGGDFRALIIPVPPIEVQREIVRILDTFTELTAELTARKQQYAYYRNNILSFDYRGSAVRKELSEIAEISTGSSNTDEAVENGQYPFYVRSQQPLLKDQYEFDEEAIITAGDGVGVGKVFHYANGKYALHQRAYRIHPISSSITCKYLYHYFVTNFPKYISQQMYQGSVASIRRPMLNQFEVLIPSLDVQQRLVEVLDNFDAICSDLNIGLPAEIEARKKQYEFYRDQLLTFAAQDEIVLTDRQTDRQTSIMP